VLDATDVVLAAEIAGGKIPADAVAMANSDMNGDGPNQHRGRDANKPAGSTALAKMLNEE